MRGGSNIIYAVHEFVPTGISTHLKEKENALLLIVKSCECSSAKDINRMNATKRQMSNFYLQFSLEIINKNFCPKI